MNLYESSHSGWPTEMVATLEHRTLERSFLAIRLLTLIRNFTPRYPVSAQVPQSTYSAPWHYSFLEHPGFVDVIKYARPGTDAAEYPTIRCKAILERLRCFVTDCLGKILQSLHLAKLSLSLGRWISPSQQAPVAGRGSFLDNEEEYQEISPRLWATACPLWFESVKLGPGICEDIHDIFNRVLVIIMANTSNNSTPVWAINDPARTIPQSAVGNLL